MTHIPKRPINEAFHKAAPFLNIIYVLFGAVALFAWLGNQADKTWDKSPLFIIIGVFLGLILGFYNMIKVVQQMERK